MSVIDWVLTGYVIIFSLAWCFIYLKAVQFLFLINVFEKLNPPAPEKLPKLSLVIAACNEAENIGQAVSTILSQDYPGLEVIIVDDRSTDETGKDDSSDRRPPHDTAKP